MGLLRDLESEKTSLLEPEHVVGRGHGCSLRLGHRFVSAQHAHLRWAHGRWEVKDLGSLNGTFLDGERIKPGDECPIKKGSRVAFGKVEKAWELVDDSGPQAMVVPLDGGDPILVEQELLVLPSDEDPRFTIYRSEGAWVLEQPNESTTPITNAQVFELEGRPWRFCCPESDWTTAVATAPNNLEVRHLQLVFLVSRDEELVEIRASSGDRSLSLGSRAFNYLLLTLARRHGRRLVTFDAATLTHDGGVGDIELLTSL